VNILLIALIMFIGSLLVIEMFLYAYRIIRNPERQKVRKRLKSSFLYEQGPDSVDITRKRKYSDIKLLNQVLAHVPGIRSLDRLMQQANSQSSLGSFALLTVALGLAGYIGGHAFSHNWTLAIGACIFLGVLPLLHLILKKKERMAKFERQLPDALELMARALRAGHAFTSGMKLAAEEFGDPLGPEFEKALDEINFGVSVSDALKEMTRRVGSPDLKFFVLSVILQRETGGNLAEIIDSIAYIIRERFKLKGKIRILAAEGKLSAIILVALPFCIAAYVRLANPEYFNLLLTRTAGKVMLLGAGVMMALGIAVMKKMINVRV
jgi:tight adherence protein B